MLSKIVEIRDSNLMDYAHATNKSGKIINNLFARERWGQDSKIVTSSFRHHSEKQDPDLDTFLSVKISFVFFM